MTQLSYDELIFFSCFLILDNFCFHNQVSNVDNFRDGLIKIVLNCLNCFDTKHFCLHNQVSKLDNFRDGLVV